MAAAAAKRAEDDRCLTRQLEPEVASLSASELEALRRIPEGSLLSPHENFRQCRDGRKGISSLDGVSLTATPLLLYLLKIVRKLSIIHIPDSILYY